ncbi:MAG: geranylgeranyl reductase family protein [Candidatus Heimdallarchaeota archaeon]|nr:geranylgeranyl reductase family protein [Candidatus Heimdallarchaeota archaeon]MBY8993710.1 geranylgeranyl reductase family protein [Candidatus Heimdallarchaeota archaeon]
MASENYDLVIIGAGTAGCLAAYSAAKEGLDKIALIDRKPRKLIGKKICGDGIGTNHLDFLQEIGFPIKENNILANTIKTAHIISPDKKKNYTLPVQGQLAIINRQQFGQTLLEETLNQGVKLFENTTFKTLKRDSKKLQIQAIKDGTEAISLTTPLIIDGSGINSRIREELGEFGENAQLRDEEQYYCYREVCQIDSPPEIYTDSAIFEFSYDLTKGGYKWFFSRGNNEYNMGTGVPKSWIKETSPKEVYQTDMSSRFSDMKVIDGGGGFVPTRHPIPTHVKDNIILIGDAGLIVNPLHGGGLSPSLASGYIAGKIAAKQVSDEKLSENDLWIFNEKIHERYGLRYSILDLYRILLQNIPDEELNDALHKEYLPLGSVFYAREYDLLMKLSRTLGEIWSQLPNPRFNRLPEFVERVYECTNKYPKSPEELEPWAKEYRDIYAEYYTLIAIR